MPWFPFIVGVIGTAIIGAIAGVVVKQMCTGELDLSQLLSNSPRSSLSRFQFLLFTFVIALSYLLLVITRLSAKDPTTAELAGLPDLSPGVLQLLGISAGSYVVGKGIQKAADTSVQRAQIQQGQAPTPAANL